MTHQNAVTMFDQKLLELCGIGIVDAGLEEADVLRFVIRDTTTSLPAPLREDRFDRYQKVVAWARKRYTRADGFLVISKGRSLSVYSRIEAAAARKHLGVADDRHIEQAVLDYAEQYDLDVKGRHWV